jgi:hypothetical protein
MAVWVDLVTDENAAPSFTRVPADATSDDRTQCMARAGQYFIVRPSLKHRLSHYMSGEVTAFLHAGSLQSSAQLPTCNPGRERRRPPLVCVNKLWRGISDDIHDATGKSRLGTGLTDSIRSI